MRRSVRYPKINYNFRFTHLMFVSTFYLLPYQNKLVALLFSSNGNVCYLQASNKYNLFSLISSSKSSYNKCLNTIPTVLYLLLYVKVLTKVSLVELYPGSGVQYVRSSGTFAKFIKINWSTHTALLELPSGVRKSFSLYSQATVGSVALREKSLVRNTKSGF